MQIKNISCEGYKKMAEEGVPHTLVDVRGLDEWQAGHIDGAIHIPLHVVPLKIKEMIPDKSTSIVVNCASGGRSMMACSLLVDMGYTDVTNLDGGYNGYCQI